MYAYVKGILVEANAHDATIDVQGIGYRICIPTSTASRLPQIGEEVLLHTFYVVREISQTLYGFLSSQERDCFELLLSVSGIGPKIALGLLGHMSTADLHEAISRGNIPQICKAPGVGKKIAERMIMELRDKLHHYSASSIAVDPHTQMLKDAMNALINLGYTQSTAQKAIKKSLKDESETHDLATLITTALKHV